MWKYSGKIPVSGGFEALNVDISAFLLFQPTFPEAIRIQALCERQRKILSVIVHVHQSFKLCQTDQVMNER